MRKRIALMGITHESNSFVKEPTTLAHFKNGHWFFGEDIRKEYANAFHEIGGMIEVIDQSDMELVPVMYAEATPGGIISADTYQVLLDSMLSELDKLMPIDACLVVPHGAGISESFPDMDGHWLSVLRQKLGEHIPIIGTIDPHANVSEWMIRSTDALVAYKTNPHIYQRETGREAASILVKQLRGELKAVQVMIQLPLAISIEQQLTDQDPCKSVLAYAKTLYQKPGILSVSLVLGFPYADVNEMGSSVIVVTDRDQALALETAKFLEHKILSNKEQFNGIKQDIKALFSQFSELQKPILLLDMGDNVGGGADGDSTYLLDALEEGKFAASFICIYDPESVKVAEMHQPGDQFMINIGHHPDTGKSSRYEVKLHKICDGQFSEKTPRHGGQLHFDMGKIAIVTTSQYNMVMLTSLRVPPYSLQQLLAFKINPMLFNVIVAKGVNAPIAAYKDVCESILQVNTPGVTQADMTRFTYHNRRKPLYPFENIIVE